MKILNIISLAFALLFALVGLVKAQQTDPTAITQEIDYHLDELGNAKMELRMKMNAMQWQNYKTSSIAKNPTVFKRDMERSMAAYVMEDMKTELKEEERLSLTTLKAKNTAVYKGKGQWEIKLGIENPNVTVVSDNCYLITGNLASNGGIIHQIQKVFFPKGAYDIKQSTDTFNKSIFTYKLDVEQSRFSLLLGLGIAAILLGGVLLFLQMRLESMHIPKK